MVEVEGHIPARGICHLSLAHLTLQVLGQGTP